MERKVILLKKKDIAMICFVIIITALSLWAIWQSSGSMSNNSGTDISENKNSSTNIDNTTKGPTIIDNSLEEQKNSSTTDKSSNNNSNTADNTDSEKETVNNSDTSKSSESFTLYEVKQGETLKDICESYSDTCPEAILSKAILSANNLSKSSDIKANLEIKIPDKYINGSKYSVKSGDSLYKIASEYFKDTDITKAIQEIKNDNFLTNDSIRLGQELFISADLIVTEEVSENEEDENTASEEEEYNSTTTSSTKVSNEDLVNYEVQEGEGLTAISKKYEEYCPADIASKTILKINNLKDSKEVTAGSEIKIPEKYLTNGEIYIVKSGDTLSSIAQDFFSDLSMNEAIEKIKSDNFLSSYNIKLGEQLFLSENSLEVSSAD
jgi:LysM repeat protein